jgi:hypothetical protein
LHLYLLVQNAPFVNGDLVPRGRAATGKTTMKYPASRILLHTHGTTSVETRMHLIRTPLDNGRTGVGRHTLVKQTLYYPWWENEGIPRLYPDTCAIPLSLISTVLSQSALL